MATLSTIQTSDKLGLSREKINQNFSNLNAGLDEKQDRLVSGASIKTINGVPVLGSGDITLSSSSGGDMAKTLYDPDNDGVIALGQGGTGATTAAGARTALGLGSAAVVDVPSSGNASSSQAVKGDDTRLVHSIGFGFNGQGSVISAGAVSDLHTIERARTIVGFSINLDVAGTVVFNIKKGTPSGGSITLASIVASAPPTITGARVLDSTTLTGWSTALAAGDRVQAEITSASSATKASIKLILS